MSEDLEHSSGYKLFELTGAAIRYGCERPGTGKTGDPIRGNGGLADRKNGGTARRNGGMTE